MSGAVYVSPASHRSQTPAKVEAYFRSREPKVVSSAFLPGRGWISFFGLASFSKMRRLRRAGYTAVAISCDGRIADFSIEEVQS